ncbi:PREDICTED: cell cycle checkpoint protein RAD1-like [Amphimedon queenslandica]|uniref:Cell cycle checkpoint protein RAD1 n=1 Tax=Amphimedon queenslandica TaxID=400682 RepID=A0A1X7T4Q3_AMPQE|nr:PREDICTED: cell cycle checkpoint protein RAD1-like [Amphimedon queenslandica]|eukprot:XP_003391123.2 PREDICTED: cell cycle checkpoint protein RAD1-like [Amphimedon queenslandica]
MESQDEHVLNAFMINARTLSNVLKAIQFRDTATCFISSTGLRVTVEQAKCVQANCFVKSDLFQAYNYNEDSTLIFNIDLNVLIECLCIFGNEANTSLRLYYDGYGTPLQLVLEENEVVTECSIQTSEADETLDFDFVSANVCNKVIIKSECMRETFNELDLSSEFIEIYMSEGEPNFRLSTHGYTGTTQFDYPKKSDMVEVFECKTTQKNKYKLALLKPSAKALSPSSKIALRMDTRGFLSLQFMIVTEDKQLCFVEYLCVPEDDSKED